MCGARAQLFNVCTCVIDGGMHVGLGAVPLFGRGR